MAEITYCATDLAAKVNLRPKSLFCGYFCGMRTSSPNGVQTSPHISTISLTFPHLGKWEREAASVQDCAVCTADHRGAKPKITAATVEMLEVGGNRWGAEVREDRKYLLYACMCYKWSTVPVTVLNVPAGFDVCSLSKQLYMLEYIINLLTVAVYVVVFETNTKATNYLWY